MSEMKHLAESLSRPDRNIVLIARKWFDRINGNTYHTVEIEIDGASIWRSPITYGYDRQYMQTAWEYLVECGIVADWREFSARIADEQVIQCARRAELEQQGNTMPESLYAECVARGIPMRNRYSDLYIPYTAETVVLVAKFGVKAEVFHNHVEGGVWFDIFGEYLPYWESKTKGTR